ncbi:MAG TPA: BatD family protein [Cyclobacteriaceae bacterium]
MRKRKFRSIFLLWFFLLCAASQFSFAQSPEFIATISANRVAQHSVFEIQFELKDANGSSFKPPSFKDFKVVGGPSMGSSTMIINGEVTQSQSWTYSLLATNVGKFSIDPASVVAGSKKLYTRPVVIEVLAQKEQAAQGSIPNTKDKVMLIAETDLPSYYPGQQIILTYRLLFTENIQSVNTLSEDDYADFFVQYFSDFSREATTVNVNGIPYTSRIIKTMALFAHQSGTYTIDPLVMTAGINAPFPGNQGFFTMRRILDVQVASAPLPIKILSLPPNAPETFSGAVGQYKMKMKPGKTTLTTDEAFTFQLEISGNGDARRWDVPVPVGSGPFELFDPKILTDQVFDEKNMLTQVRTVAYNMIPTEPGEYTVHIPFTYFDPDEKRYVTISTETIQLHVTKGTGIRADSLSVKKPDDSNLTLMPTGHLWLKDKFWVSFPHLFLFVLLLSGSGYGAWLTYKQNQESHISTGERTRMSAGIVAQRNLEDITAQQSSLSSTAFFEKATQIYYTFLTDRFMIPPSELDESNLAKYLAKAKVPEDLTRDTVEFFTQCIEVRYGGIPGGYSKEEMLQKCHDLVSRLSA